nr:phosphoketolase family protein [Candidatus Gracilibacteria bacterium]
MSPKITLSALEKYVRLTNYLSVAQIYLRDNIFLERPLCFDDIKPRLLGHWGTCPGINLVYAHLNRLAVINSAKMMLLVGPGHGFPAIQSNLFVEGSLSHFYPEKIAYTKAGIREICENFSAPYGHPSHANPEAPATILEGGELGYSLSVAYGAALDHPDLIVSCLVGDGEAETGPLAAAWQINKIFDPRDNGAVLPIIHLNGYKISGPTCFGRMDNNEMHSLFTGYGYHPLVVDYHETENLQASLAVAMDQAYQEIRFIQKKARAGDKIVKPRWPLIVLRTPKGDTAPAYDGEKKLVGNCPSHQVLFSDVKKNKEHL